MAETVSISSGIADRYASALFDLALEAGALEALEADIAALEAALGESADFRALISSPLYTRSQQADAMAALAPRMGLGTLTASTLGLMASKRRLFALPQLLAALRARIARERGEVSAEVVSARPLSAEQSAALAAALNASVGKEVRISASVDPALIGGLIVKLGSKMIDASVRSKLSALQNTMKEVG